MKPDSVHPWQKGPTELFKFALENFRHTDEINRRISFLLLDVGMETLFKTYLTLPEKVTKSLLPYIERKRYADGNFHNLLEGIRRAAHTKINEITLNHVEYYHGIRNNLYHEGNGITVRQDYVDGYIMTATTLLKQLLDVDLTNLIMPDPLIDHQKEALNKDMDILNNMHKELNHGVSRLKDLVRLFTEQIEPKLIYPSTVLKLNEIAKGISVATFPSKLEEFRILIETNLVDPEIKSWFLQLISEDISYDHPQVLLNTQFIMELGKDQISFCLFLIGLFYLPIDDITKDTIEKNEDISFINSDDYHILGIYEAACYFLDLTLSVQNNSEIKGRLQEIISKLNDIVNKMEVLLRKSSK